MALREYPADRGRLRRQWSQQTLADRAGVGMMTVHQFERDGSHPRRATQDVVRRAFEAAGVQFIDENGGGPGVRLRVPTTKKSREK
jgi:transcriptional regulator with XRE-family HTH domain